MSWEAKQEALDAAIAANVPDDSGEPSMPVGWVLVAEMLDAEGERSLCYRMSKDSRTWQIYGYLYSAIDMIADHERGAYTDPDYDEDA